MKNRNFKHPLSCLSCFEYTLSSNTRYVVDFDQHTARQQWECVLSQVKNGALEKLLNYYRDLHKFPIEIFQPSLRIHQGRGPSDNDNNNDKLMTVEHVLGSSWFEEKSNLWCNSMARWGGFCFFLLSLINKKPKYVPTHPTKHTIYPGCSTTINSFAYYCCWYGWMAFYTFLMCLWIVENDKRRWKFFSNYKFSSFTTFSPSLQLPRLAYHKVERERESELGYELWRNEEIWIFSRKCVINAENEIM